jgi:hypothetical protein
MRNIRTRRPSPALIVSFVALLVALGGTSYAAFSLPKNSVGTKQIKNKAVTNSKIKNGAVTASKINALGLTVPNASHANIADTASNATKLGGQAASAYVRTGTTGEAWHVVGSSGEPGLQNGWVTADSSNAFPPASFYIDPIGIVHLRGLVGSGTASSVVFTLPPGYRPPKDLAFAVAAGTGAPAVEDVDVYSNGDVFAFGPVTSAVTLDGVSFRAS